MTKQTDAPLVKNPTANKADEAARNKNRLRVRRARLGMALIRMSRNRAK